MSLTLDIPDEARARLEAEAARRGMDVDALVTELAHGLPAGASTDRPSLSFIGAGRSGRGDLARTHREDRHEQTGELGARDF